MRIKKNQQLIISTPKPPVSTVKLVILRTTTIMVLLLSAVLIHISVIFQPWKQEGLGKKKVLEFSVWKVCQFSVKRTKCYKGLYDDPPDWFLAFRWFLISSILIQYLAMIFIMLRLLLTKNSGQRHFCVSAFMSLTSAAFILTAMLLLVGYSKFEFMEETRMYKMGWRYQAENEEGWGWPYYLSWCNFAICLLSFFLCMFTQHVDTKYGKFYATEGLRRKVKQMIK